MTRFERVIAILDQAIGGPDANIGVHGAFWRGLTRDQFVAKKVRSLDLVVVGDGAGSNLVKALKGESPFGADLPEPPPDARISRMPAGLPPVPDADIAFIISWIDRGCPEGPEDEAPVPAAAPALVWWPTNVPKVAARYDDIWFVDPQTGWGVNSNGQILHSIDGFASHQVQFHDGGVYLRCVVFASPTRGWVGSLTEGKILFETSDAGATWTPVADLPADAPVAVCGLWAVNEAVVYATGSNHPEQPVRMMRTTDSGRTWTAWDMRPWADNLIDVFFPTAERGWVVGGRADEPRGPVATKPKLRPVLLHTEDGGVTWTDRLAGSRDQFPLGEWGWKIQFLDDRIGFVSLQNYDAGAILTTTDGGATWVRRPINDPQMNANIEGIGFVDEKRGWVGGWGDRPKQKRTSSGTTDGGLTWHGANEIGRTINRFRFFGAPVSAGYAAGETIYRFGPDPGPAVADLASAGRDEARIFDSVAPLETASSASITIVVPPGTARLVVRVWDPDGPLVCTLVDEQQPAAGPRTVLWSRADDDGRKLPIQSFVWRVTVDGTSESRLVMVTD